MVTCRRFRLTSGLNNALVLSSYRATFTASLSRIISNAERMDDELWLLNVAMFLNAWFVYESEIVTADSKTLLEILVSRGLLRAPNGGVFHD